MQVYSIVEKEAQMNRTAQIIREIVLSRLSVYIRVCGGKNDEPCRTHAKKYLNSICLQIHTDYVAFLFEKRFLRKEYKEDNDKRRGIEARNTGLNGRQSGDQKPRYPVRGDVNPIASRFSSALHRCYNCC